MPARIQRLLTWTGGQIPTILTLAALGALAVWGAANDWKIPASWSPAARETAKEPAEAAVKVVPDATEAQSTAGTGHAFTSKQIEFPTGESVSKAGIQVATVKIKTVQRYVTANGSIDYEPSLYARVTARATGTVWRLEKEAGDKVDKGEVLALLESADVGKAKADFLQSLAQVRLRAATLEQLQSLGDNGAISRRSLREAESGLREARIRLFNDHQALLNLGLRFKLKDVENLSEEKLALFMRLLGLPERLLKELDRDTLTANLLPVVSPLEGLVVQRYAALGELQQTTQPRPMYMVADTRKLHFEIDVNPEDIGHLRLEQEVTFRPEGATADAASGKLSHISPEIDEKTRRIRVHAEFENPNRLLRPNTFGTARIHIGEHAGVPVVPSEAVQSEGSNHFVFVRVSKTAFRARLVQPGLREGNLLEVGGVRAGEEVVTAGSFTLKSELLKHKIAGSDD